MAAKVEQRIVWQPQRGPQTLALQCGVPDLFFGGARGGGKSDALIGKAIQHAERWGKHARGFIARQQFPQLREVVDRMVELTAPFGVRHTKGDHRFVWPNGATMFYGGLEREADADKWQGANLTFFGVDEAGNFDSDAGLNRIFASMRSTKGVRVQRFMTGNPGGPGHQWLKERYIDVTGAMQVYRPARGQQRVFIPSFLEDNELLTSVDPEYVNRLHDAGPSWLIEAWLKGDWSATLVGKLIKLANLRRYDEAPDYDACDRRIITLDAAVKDREWESRNVAQHWGQVGADKFLLEEWAEHATYPELRDAVRAMAERLRPNALVIEDKGNGSALIQEFRADPKFLTPVEAIEPVANKILRMDAETSQIDEGMVWVPRWSPWLAPWETEVALFPQGKWKDRVDAMSLALWFLRAREIDAWNFDFLRDRGNAPDQPTAMPAYLRRPLSGFRPGR